jgi:hypothetical protein
MTSGSSTARITRWTAAALIEPREPDSIVASIHSITPA